jgi:hypothetical protein
MDWDWCWEPGRKAQESLAGSRGTPHPLAVGFPATPTPIPLPSPHWPGDGYLGLFPD